MGLIEKWGRGTNRVAEMCEAAGIARPEFAEIGGAAVTFRVRVGETRLTPQVALQVTPQVEALLRLLAAEGPLSNAAIRAGLELSDRVHVRDSYMAPALEAGLVEMTVPGKPRSRLQRYRPAAKGPALLAAASSRPRE